MLHMMISGFMMFFRTTEPARKRHIEKLPEQIISMNEKSIVENMKEIERLILRAIKV